MTIPVYNASIPSFLLLDDAVPVETVLAEADGLISGNRDLAYGHPVENFKRLALLWTAHMEAHYGIHVPLTAEDVGWMLMQLKQSREMNLHKRDNIVDAAGYIGCVQRIHDWNEHKDHE